MDLPIADVDKCKESYGFSKDDDQVICAGDEKEGGKDSCWVSEYISTLQIKYLHNL